MEENIQMLISQLENGGILLCLVGELALQYYNVPRVVYVYLFQRTISCAWLTQRRRTWKYAFQRHNYKKPHPILHRLVYSNPNTWKRSTAIPNISAVSRDYDRQHGARLHLRSPYSLISPKGWIHYTCQSFLAQILQPVPPLVLSFLTLFPCLS
jgi:hypothetical protein